MTKRDEAWSEIAGGGDWGQTWRDTKAGLRPTAIEGQLNALALGLLHAPRHLYEDVRHPVNALRRLHQQGEAAAANNLRLLHQIYNPRATPAERQKAQDALIGRLSPLLAGVIKEPGGNWLSGGVERALEPLHHRTPESFRARYVNEHLKDPSDQELRAYASKHGYFPPHEQALNDWVDKKLGKYVKNDMGTERDPVRALAEQGILHVEPG